MALTGVHIVFGAVNYGVNLSGANTSAGQSVLLARALLSETMASPGVSSIAAPSRSESNNKVALSISSEMPIFYAVGPVPDATISPRRYYEPGFGREDIFVDPGDKFAWVLA